MRGRHKSISLETPQIKSRAGREADLWAMSRRHPKCSCRPWRRGRRETNIAIGPFDGGRSVGWSRKGPPWPKREFTSCRSTMRTSFRLAASTRPCGHRPLCRFGTPRFFFQGDPRHLLQKWRASRDPSGGHHSPRHRIRKRFSRSWAFPGSGSRPGVKIKSSSFPRLCPDERCGMQ